MKQYAVKRATITDDGQITIPQEVRYILGSRHVEFVVEREQVILRPAQTALGSLSYYADPSLRECEEGAWPSAASKSPLAERFVGASKDSLRIPPFLD